MRALVALAICAITVMMAVGYGFSTRPVLADNQLYYFQTERCASGVPPHVSHMEVKTQLPSMIGGASIAIGRLFGADDVYSGRASSIAAAALATIFAWLLVLELAGGASGAMSFPAFAASLVGAAATFSIFGLFAEATTGFQPKVYMVMFLLATHLACAQRRYLLTGIAGVCTFLCWQPSGLVLASCGLALLLDRRTTWRSVFVVAAGVLLAFAGYEAYFALAGGLREQIEQEWLLAFGAPHKEKPFSEGVWFVLTEAQAFRSRPNGLPSVFLAVAALLWIGLLVRPRAWVASLREKPGMVAFWLAAHIATAFTLYDHQAHPDMLLVQPYFAVACGIGAAWLFAGIARMVAGRGGRGDVSPGRVSGTGLRDVSTDRAATLAESNAVAGRGMTGRVLVGVLAAVFVALGLYDAQHDVTRSYSGRHGLEEQRAMGRLVSMYYDHRGSVWALGSVHLLALNRRDNWTSVGNVGHESAKLDMKSYRPLRDGVMPEIIISGRGLRPGASGWLSAEYVDITPVPLAGSRIRIFSRKSEDQPGFARTTAPRGAPGPRPTPKK